MLAVALQVAIATAAPCTVPPGDSADGRVAMKERELIKVTPGMSELPSTPTPYNGINLRFKVGNQVFRGGISEYSLHDTGYNRATYHASCLIVGGVQVRLMEVQPDVAGPHTNYEFVYQKSGSSWKYVDTIANYDYPIRVENGFINVTHNLSKAVLNATVSVDPRATAIEHDRIDSFTIVGGHLKKVSSHEESRVLRSVE